MSEPTLKPCPFCGGNAGVGQCFDDKSYYFINCGECNASTDQLSGWPYTKQQVINAWNKRRVNKISINEESYIRGSRTAYSNMLRTCCDGLGYNTTESDKSAWIIEREGVISALRDVCASYGDNNWDEHLNLADVIAKHLHRNLEVNND